MTGPDEPRQRYCVGAVKIPYEDRDLVHAVLDDGDRGWRDIMGADTEDNHEQHPVGADVAYTLELTDAEAAQFADASNARYVELDGDNRPHRAVGRPTGADPIPSLATLAHMRARYVDLRAWHGRDVRVAVLDQGTTQAVRDRMGFTLVARTISSGITLPAGQELADPDHSHGCLVAPNAVPAGGLLLDCIISDNAGSAPNSSIAAGITWAVDNGAKVINCSFGASPGVPPQVLQDAMAYARDNGGVQIVMSAGNDSLADIASPSSGSRLFANVHSSIAFDESTDRRGLFSNHHADGSGCSSGVYVDSLSIFGTPLRWNGTSASSPHMAYLLARALTGGTYTPTQVGAAFKANTRDTGAGASEQGGGAYDLHRALVALGSPPAVPSTIADVTHISTVGGSAVPTAWNLTPATGVQADDTQIAVIVSSAGAGLVRPEGAAVLTDLRYDANWEANAGQTVGPSRARVVVLPYTAAQPSSVPFSFGGGTWFSAVAFMTLRGTGGLDAERFVPVVKFGTGGTIDTVPVVPHTARDLLVCVFSQRHPTSLTGTLSIPSGLTDRGFWRPTAAGTTTGYTLRVATLQLTSSARTAAYTSTSNDATGTWCSIAFTVPPGPAAVATVTQTEPTGPPGGLVPFLPRG